MGVRRSSRSQKAGFIAGRRPITRVEIEDREILRARAVLFIVYLALAVGLVLVAWTRGDLAEWIEP